MKNTQKNENEEIVTKGYLKELLSDVVNKLTQYIDYKVKPFENMEQDYKDFKNLTFKNLDWLAAQYEKFDDKYNYVSSKFIDLEDRYTNHEQRVALLERNELRRKN